MVDSSLKIINNEASMMALQVDNASNKNREMAKIINTLRTPPKPTSKHINVNRVMRHSQANMNVTYMMQ